MDYYNNNNNDSSDNHLIGRENYIIPGSFTFPRPVSPNNYQSTISNSLLDTTNTTNLIKIKNNLKVEFLKTLNILILFELIIVYFIDQSFLKLLIKGCLQLLLVNINLQNLNQWIEFNLMSMSNNDPSVFSDQSMINNQIQYFKSFIFFEIVLLHIISLIDHTFTFSNYADISTDTITMSTYNFKFDYSKFSNLLVRYLNKNTEQSLIKYENTLNYQYSSMFINLIGELKSLNNYGLITLDVILAISQFVMFLIVFNDIKPSDNNNGNGSDRAVNEGTNLIQADKTFEDGYQGSIVIFKVDLFPKVTFSQLKDKMKFT